MTYEGEEAAIRTYEGKEAAIRTYEGKEAAFSCLCGPPFTLRLPSAVSAGPPSPSGCLQLSLRAPLHPQAQNSLVELHMAQWRKEASLPSWSYVQAWQVHSTPDAIGTAAEERGNPGKAWPRGSSHLSLGERGGKT